MRKLEAMYGSPAFFWRVLLIFFFGTSALLGQTLDTLTFGNTASESAHSLNSTYSDTFTGGLGQSARRLLPKPQTDVYGGEMTLTMAVDPIQQNYFSIKLWGSDTNSSGIWFVLNINGLELGDRHGTFSGEDPLWFQGVSWFTNCFIYRTLALPLHLTRGKTSVTLKIRSLGWMSYYDSGPYFNHYQKLMNAPSVGIYRAYTHAGSIVDTSAEAQGATPTLPTPRPLENETTTLNIIKANVNSALSSKLNASAASLSAGDIQFLAQCYDAKENFGESWLTYPSGKTATNLINQILAAIDSEAMNQSTSSSYINQQGNSSWGGYFGPLGDAIRIVWPQLSNSMSATVSFGGAYGTTTRLSGWSQALRASVDAGRFSRRTIANQALAAADNTYLANRGLQLVDPANAIIESEAIRYVKEACGVLPWYGDDQAGGTAQVPVKGAQPYGTNWFMCTTKGTTKDGDGFVGSDYGELGTWVYRLGLVSGDAQLQARGIVMTRARCLFRFPAPDGNGYLVMQGTEPIGERNNGLPGHYVYLGRTSEDDFLMAAQGAGVIGNDLLGYFQQESNDGQLASLMSGIVDPYLPMRYTAIKSYAQTGVKLPMSIGAADFAWADEENMVFAAKHGEERIFANLYWRQPGWINALAKVFCLNTNQARLADVLAVDQSFKSGGAMTVLGPLVETFSYDTPPDNPINAYNGVPALVAWRSDLTNSPPSNRDGGRGTGYTFRYGNWLVGINAHYTSNYVMQLPAGFTNATNMIDGTVLAAPVTLAPKTTAVFYLPTNMDTAPLPSRPIFITAAGGNARSTVSWTHGGGATGYNVKRSLTSGSGFTTIAASVANNFYTDTTVANGTAYFYVVSSTNNIGESGDSPEASAKPLAPQTVSLPAPWANTNVGFAGGGASLAGGMFTLNSAPGDIWGNSDGFHFVYQPMIGDGVVVARVDSSTSGNTYAKAGLMIRDSLDSNAVHCAITMERVAGRAEMGYRTGTGGGSANKTSGSGLTLPYWVKLQRAASTITTYISPNGTNWTLVGSQSLGNLDYVAYVGLCASPANGTAGQTTTATFKFVTLPLGASAAPATPAGLTALGANAGAVLNWNSVSNAVTYNVKRGASAGGPFTAIAGGVINPTFTDYGLSNGTNYFYVVSAVNDAGESADSAAAVALPGPPPPMVAQLLAAGTNGGISLTWAASAGATGYNLYRANYSSSTMIFSLLVANVSGTNYFDAAVTANAPYFYYVTALTNASESQWSAQVGAVAPGVPSPWINRDIGRPDMPGYAFQTNGVFNLNAAGNDIWNSSDQLNFTFQSAGTNCDIRARVVTVEATAVWAKAGVMIRESLNANSPFVDCYLTPVVGTTTNGVAFQRRSSAGASAAAVAQTGGLVAPYWVRLTRTNSTFTAWRSPDGATWTSMGSTSITMSNTVLIGLPLCSLSANSVNTSLIDSVTVSPGTPSVPAGLTTTPGDAQVVLNWNASLLASGYNLKRATISGGPYETILTHTTGLAFTNTGLANGTKYFYVVTATNYTTESGNSVEASARPVSTSPAQLNFGARSGQLQFTWPQDHTGWRLEAQTNSLGTGLATNWVTVSGSTGTNQMFIPVNPANGSVFFRLVYP